MFFLYTIVSYMIYVQLQISCILLLSTILSEFISDIVLESFLDINIFVTKHAYNTNRIQPNDTVYHVYWRATYEYISQPEEDPKLFQLYSSSTKKENYPLVQL